MAEQSKELQEFFVAVAKLRTHLAADSKGTALVEDALSLPMHVGISELIVYRRPNPWLRDIRYQRHSN
jgi:hypothetical protein